MDATGGAVHDRRGGGPAVGRRRRGSRRCLLAAALLAIAGCRGAPVSGTNRMVPRGWKGNPWGPSANEARRTGAMVAVPTNPEMDAWTAWGRRNLRDGDLLFRMGNARAVLGLFPFSKFSAAIAESRYSHSGVVAIEGGEPVVYDTTTTGPQRQPFAVWVLDTHGSLAVKRPKPEYAGCAAGAVAYCRRVYREQTPYDYGMALGDDKLYCIEMTERAYRVTGLPLSEPVRLDTLPRYREFPWTTRLIRLCTTMEPAQKSFVIGNDRLGLWSSPALDLVYEAPHPRPPGWRPFHARTVPPP